MPLRRLIVIVLTPFLLFIATAAFAGTVIHVPQDQPTIQAGINAAVDGDTVLVSPGTYYENIDFHGKAITVTSANGPAQTVIDGSKAYGSTANFSSSETSVSVLNGFTIQNTSYNSVTISYSSPTISGNILNGIPNTSWSSLSIQSGAPTIQGNLIAGTSQTGINSYFDTGIQIKGNLVANNSGAGIAVEYSNGVPVIGQNTVVGNRGSGIAYYGSGYGVTLVQNLVTGNMNTGVVLSGGGPVNMVSNTVADNNFQCCNGSSEVGIDQVSSDVTLQNNLVVAAGTWSAFSCQNLVSAPNFANNDIFAANATPYTGPCPDLTGTSGNISADPLFVDLLSDNLHLQLGSPAIDAGTNAASGEPAQDFDGDSRIAGNAIDIGADEYTDKPHVGISPFGIHFGPQNVGTTSSPQTVTVTNNGASPLALNLVATSPNFSQTNNCGTVLAAGANCKISVTFSPLSGGAIRGVVGIFTDATLNPIAVTLLGTGQAPQVQLNTNFYFWNQVIGTSATQSGTLTNVGQAPLSISSILYSGSMDFVETNNCPIAPATLAAGGSCIISVTYTPTVIANENGTISFIDNAQYSPQTAYVSGSSVSAGVPIVTPNTLTFPPTLIGQSSPPQTATLTNAGTGPLGITNIYSYNNFQQTNNCPSSLPAGASCTLTVTFTPTTQGSQYGYIWINNDSSNWSVQISGTGTGVAPVPAISSLSLSSAPAGSPDTQVTITGTGFVGGSRVLWNGSQIPYSYSYGNTQINFTIPASDLANAGVDQISVYTPQPGGGTSAAVPFTVYIPITYASRQVAYKYRSITGTNLKLYSWTSAMVASPFPVQFGGGSYTSMTVGGGGTISFSGYATPYNYPLPTNQTQTLVAPFWTYLNPWGTGNDNNVFWSVLGTAPNRMLVVEWRNVPYCCYQFGGTVKFEVVFFEGNSNVQFNYADTVFGGGQAGDDNGATATVGIQITPTQATQFSYNTPSLSSKMSLLWYPSAPTATVSTSALDFGYHKIGSASKAQKFTLTNGSYAALNINNIGISSSDFAQTNDCGTTVAPGSSCTFLVTFIPSQPVAETATLTISDNATNSPQTVSLSGIGAIQPIVVFPIKLNFGAVTVGQTATLPVTLANAANSKLTIEQISATPDVFTVTHNCGTSLAAGASCTVNVAFTPKQAGSVTGKLQMGLNGKALVTESKLVGSGQ